MAISNTRFREERQRSKLSHAKVADICGVAESSVIAWEKGSKIPAEALAALVEAGTGFDYQYVITGVRWGLFGPQDAALAAMSGAQRMAEAFVRLRELEGALGVQFTPEQLGALGGYVVEHCPTRESLEAFVRAAYAVKGSPTQHVTGHGNITAGGNVSGVNVGGVSVDTPAKKGTKKKK